MLDYVVGVIKSIKEQEIVIDLGIVGLTLQVPHGKVFEIDAKITMYSYMHWNEQTGPTLFGFQSALDRSIFCTIISCSGIGPKIALAILAELGSHGFLQAITEGNEEMLSTVNGIGKKKAEQMIVALKHKVADFIEVHADLKKVEFTSHFHDVTQALLSLNYSRPEINRAIDYLKKHNKGSQESFDYLFRYALSYLSKQT